MEDNKNNTNNTNKDNGDKNSLGGRPHGSKDKKKRKRRTWKPHQVKFLQENYFKMSQTALAKKLRKTVSGIRLMAGRLDLKKPIFTWSIETAKERLGSDYKEKKIKGKIRGGGEIYEVGGSGTDILGEILALNIDEGTLEVLELKQ